MSHWTSPQMKRNFYKLSYGGSLKEGELAVDDITLNFQKGEKSRLPFPKEYPGDMHHGPEVRFIEPLRKMSLTSPETLDFEKVELRVMATIPEPSDEDLEAMRKLRPLINEHMEYAMYAMLGAQPPATDVEFTVIPLKEVGEANDE